MRPIPERAERKASDRRHGDREPVDVRDHW
jgi:hypothetical protein